MTGQVLTAAERRRSLAAVMSCVGVSGLCFGLTSPLLTLLLERQGVDAVLIGLSAATSSAVRASPYKATSSMPPLKFRPNCSWLSPTRIQ